MRVKWSSVDHITNYIALFRSVAKMYEIKSKVLHCLPPGFPGNIQYLYFDSVLMFA